MTSLIMIIAVTVSMAGVTWLAVRRRAARLDQEAADDRAVRDLYDHYRSGIDMLTQAYLAHASSDEEWLDGIRAQGTAAGGPRQAGPILVQCSLRARNPGRPLIRARLVLDACLLLLAVVLAGAIIIGGLLLAGQDLSGWLAMTAVVGVGGYFASLRIHPLRKCPTCRMTGRHFRSGYGYSYRRCRTCDGSGRVDRLGARIFFGGTADTGIFPRK